MLDTIKPVALGLLVFVIIVTGGTYLLQDNLWLVKLPETFEGLTKTNAIYIHWAVVLILLPFITGTVLKMIGTPMTWLVIILGTAATVAILYPVYSGRFWAEAPKVSYVATYCVMVMGSTYFANQPLKTTFMMAMGLFLRRGGSSKPAAKPNAKPASKPSASSKARMSQTQRIRSREHGDIIALIELLVGVVSLVLSVFSIFVLGQG